MDNSATALTIAEGSNTYMTFITTNSGEKITTGKTLVVDGDGTTGNGGVSIENGTIDLKNGGVMILVYDSIVALQMHTIKPCKQPS